MYYLFNEKNILPGQYYNLPYGEKVVVRAFFEFDMEQRIESDEKIKNQIRVNKLLNK